MKLNLYIVKEDFPEWELKGNGIHNWYDMEFSYPMLITGEWNDFENDILYVIPVEYLPAYSKAVSDVSILCIGQPPEIWLQNRANLIYTERNLSWTETMNSLLMRMNYYQQWENSLQEVVDHHQPLSVLAEKSKDLIQNPILVQGSSFRILFAHVPPSARKDEQYLSYKKRYTNLADVPMNNEEIMAQMTSPSFEETFVETEPSFFPNSKKYDDVRCLYYNVFRDGELIARIYMDEMLNAFTARDCLVLKVLGGFIQKGIQPGMINAFYRPADMDEILGKLLSHILVPDYKIRAILNYFRWKEQDSYVCVVLKSKIMKEDIAIETLVLNLREFTNKSCFTRFEQNVVFICNLTALHMTRDEVISKLIPYFRDNMITASFSVEYMDFRDLYYYYHQAVDTFEIGAARNPKCWYFRFEDYPMDYLLYKYRKKTIPEAIIPQGLKRLIAYDAAKGTNYVKLLRVYLEKERSTVETIRVMYMHKNTFTYQIKKILQIVNEDFNDVKIRLVYLTVFQVLESETSKRQNGT